MSKGYAYVPPVLLDSLLAGHFRARLSEALAVSCKLICDIMDDVICDVITGDVTSDGWC